MAENSGQDGGYQTAADCISAGMYWFSQSDLAAAEAWWRRALELEPHHPRAQACLRLLQRTSSTGFKADSWARLPASRPEAPVEATTDVFSDPAGASPSAAAEVTRSSPPVEEGSAPPRAVDPELGSLDLELESGRHDASGATGLGRFLAEAEGSGGAPDERPTHDLEGRRGRAPPAPAVHSPWDEGPSRTSVVTLRSSGDFDAVADPTPLPEVDRERFFNRGDPSSRDEIVDFLRATGDLPQNPEEDIASLQAEDAPDAPLSKGTAGLSADLEGMSIADAVSTEPSTRVSASSSASTLQVARDRYQLHDFQGVLDALEDYPADAEAQTEVRNMIAESRANLLRMYEAKIGSLEQVPGVKVSSEEIIWLNLNHRAGFILSQVDGTVSYEDLVSLSGMPRLDTVRILTELLDQRVIGPT